MRAKSIFVCGGDMRSAYIAEYFRKKGHLVSTYGHDCSEESFENVLEAEVVVLGLPAVKEGMVYMPLKNEKILFSELLKKCGVGTIVCGGRFTDSEKLVAEKYNVTLWDYSEDETSQIENALYTAEGALSKLIENTPVSVKDCRILVAGYGRIGKAIANLINGGLWDVCVYARRSER